MQVVFAALAERGISGLQTNFAEFASQTVSFSAPCGTKPVLQQVSFQATPVTVSHSSTISLSVANPVYAYVASLNPPPTNILGHSVDANSGKVSALSASPVSLPSFPKDIVVASETGGAFLFALTSDPTSESSEMLSKVDAASGSLTLLQSINYQPGGNQEYLAVHPSGKFLYVTQSTCTLSHLIDPATGKLTESSWPELSQSGNLATYSVNQSDGSLTLLQAITFNDLGSAGSFLLGIPSAMRCTRYRLGRRSLAASNPNAKSA